MNLSGSLAKKFVIGCGAALIFVGLYIYNTTDVASQAVRYRLEALCTGIYEYHASTGSGPAALPIWPGLPWPCT